MAEEASSSPGPFDVPTIKSLIRMMSQNDVRELDLRCGDQRIHLVRGGDVQYLPSPNSNAPTPALPASMVSPAPQRTDEAQPVVPAKTLYEIKSPTPGTFYAAPSPDAEPFVKVGSRVTPDTVVCLIEAMKLFTELFAEVNGVIAEILVQNQQPVEFGTVLFRVDTSV